MSRFYVRPEFVRGERIYIRGKEQHHIQDVMRLDAGDEVTAFDGTGVEYVGIIEDASSREVVVKIRETRPVRNGISNGARKPVKNLPDVTLAVSIPKFDKMDLIVQKATELGVHEIIPLLSERSVVALDERKAAIRLERWQNIAVEASKQCGRASLPSIAAVTTFTDALMQTSRCAAAFLFALDAGAVSLKEALRGKGGGSAILFIGPEGDWTPGEIRQAKAAGCRSVSLGPLVLRVETAAIAALSIVFYELSEVGNAWRG